MEFSEVVRRRHMVRSFGADPVAPELVDAVIDTGLRAPSAGYSQGWAFVVLEGALQTEGFWARVADAPAWAGRWAGMRTAPVVILPLTNKDAYLRRYAEPDKAGLGMKDEAAWRVPYWTTDVAFAVMSMLLAATDAGLGALFFGIAVGEAEVLADLGVPAGYEPIGALLMGWPSPDDRPSPSLRRGRRPRSDTVHYGRWGEQRP